MTQNQEMDAGQITDRIAKDLKARLDQGGEHMQVMDKNGEHVGTLDHLDGDRIKLTRSDSSDGQHHYVPLSQVESMDNVAVHLNITREEAMK